MYKRQVVKLKNFRDRWVGSSEGNLEKIFRLVRALGRCIAVSYTHLTLPTIYSV